MIKQRHFYEKFRLKIILICIGIFFNENTTINRILQSKTNITRTSNTTNLLYFDYFSNKICKHLFLYNNNQIHAIAFENIHLNNEIFLMS